VEEKLKPGVVESWWSMFERVPIFKQSKATSMVSKNENETE
jgi:hypothetical protein